MDAFYPAPRTRLAALATAALLAFGTGACGGDDEPAAPATAAQGAGGTAGTVQTPAKDTETGITARRTETHGSTGPGATTGSTATTEAPEASNGKTSPAPSEQEIVGVMDHVTVIAEGDAICQRMRTRVRKRTEEAGPSREEQADAYADLGLLVSKATTKLGRLAPPPQDRKALATYIERLKVQSRLLYEMGEAVRDGDENAQRSALRRINANRERASQAAKSVGFAVCGS